MTEQKKWRLACSIIATFLSGMAVIVIYLALVRQHDVWFGRTAQSATISGLFYTLAAAAGIVLAMLLRGGGVALVVASLVTAVTALLPLLLPEALVGGWQRLLLEPYGFDGGAAVTAQCWRIGLRLALPGLAAGFLAAGGNSGLAGLSWRHSVVFLLGVILGASAFRTVMAATGFESLLTTAAVVAAVAALFHLLATSLRSWGQFAGVVLVAGVVAAAVFVKLPFALLANSPAGRWAESGSAFAYSGAPLYHSDGGRASASIYFDHDYGRVLTINGRPVAFETRFRGARLVEAHLPLLLAPRVGRVALFGEEAPLAQRAARLYRPERLACRGADRAIFEAVAVFEADVAALRSSRVATAAGSGGSGSRYDVLHVMPGPAWTRQGASALRGSAFNRYGRVVADDGVVALSLSGSGLSAAAFYEIVAAFNQSFPHSQLWCTGLEHWLLLGSRRSLVVPLERLQERFENEVVFRELLGAGVVAMPELLSACVLDEAGVRAFLATPPKKSGKAGRGSLFMRSDPRQLQAIVEPFRSVRCDWLESSDEPEVIDSLRKRVARLLAVRGVVVTQLVLPGVGDSVPPAIQRAAEYNRRDLLLHELAERIELEAVRRLAFGDALGAIKRFEEILLLQPDDAVTHFRLSLANQRLGQSEAAFWHSGRAAALAPQTAPFRIRFAEAALQAGQPAEAVRQYREALASDSTNIEARAALARLLGSKTTPGYDIQEAVKLAEEAYAQSGQRHAPTGYILADLYLEAGRVYEGVALKRAIKKAAQSSGVR